jgi:oxygen-independent coproporphyrinogen III oxidase
VKFNSSASVESLYIHWPFCPYKCYYCPFVALAGHDDFMERYHYALTKEIACFAKEYQNRAAIKTIFFGGGTPSTYPLAFLTDMLNMLTTEYIFDVQVEITLEVNPGTVTLEKLHAWKQIGINRLSIGVQSLNDQVLKKLNRHQSAQDVRFLLTAATSLFENISVDIILGLPGIDDIQWKEFIEILLTWPINHVSMYFLTVHEETPLYFGIKQQKFVLPCQDSVIDLYYWTVEKFNQAGIYQYEVSNFARPTYQSRHNSTYWQRKPYKGFGLGACSFDGAVRLQNEKSLLKYLENVESNKELTNFYEKLDNEQIWLEVLMLGLRQSKGLSLESILEQTCDAKKTRILDIIDMLVQEKLVLKEHGCIRLTVRGLAVVNEITVKLLSI